MGAISRSERFNTNYIKIISDILLTHENALYVYGSTNEVTLFEEYANKKVLRRIKYLDFIDPLIYSQVIDVIADPFPFGSTLIALYCMRNDSSIVTMNTLNAQISSWYAYYGEDRITELRNHTAINPFPESETEYKESLNYLCRNQKNLQSYKNTLKEFHQQHTKTLNNPKEYLEDLISTIKES